MAGQVQKLFYKIGEVCEICDVQPHVLRYWETEFSMLSPSKNSSGQRIYRHRDVELIGRIKRLLYQEGYTIAGANKKLMSDVRSGEDGDGGSEQAGQMDMVFALEHAVDAAVTPPRAPEVEVIAPVPLQSSPVRSEPVPPPKALLSELRRQLEEVLTLLR